MIGTEKSEPVSQYHFLVIQCYSCGQFLIAKSGQKNKLCTYCNTRINVFRVKLLARASTAVAASEIVKALKEKHFKS